MPKREGEEDRGVEAEKNIWRERERKEQSGVREIRQNGNKWTINLTLFKLIL